MKTATIPFTRNIQTGVTGPDVLAVKRALKNWGLNHADPNVPISKGITQTTAFGQQASDVLVEFKKRRGLLLDPIYTVEAHKYLAPFFDAFGASLMNKEYRILLAQRQRAAYVAALEWGVTHRAQFSYAEVRPIPINAAPFGTEHIVTDCSGWVTL